MGAAFTIGSQPETTLHCIYQVAVEVEPLKIYFPSPLKHHQSPHVCSHILRGGTFLLSPAERFSEIKLGTTYLDTVPDAEESKPAGILTHQHHLGGRACRKLGGAGSSPKNASIVETLRGFRLLTDITL